MCVWNSDEELLHEDPIRTCKVTKRFKREHEIVYFCDCAFHYGTLYSFDNHDQAHLICEGAKNRMQKEQPDMFRELDFLYVANVKRINVF